MNAIGTAGGILIGWCDSRFDIILSDIRRFSVSVTWWDRVLNFKWMFTCVYGPSEPALTKRFWRELKEVNSFSPGPCVVGGDFNATCRSMKEMVIHSRERFLLPFYPLSEQQSWWISPSRDNVSPGLIEGKIRPWQN